MPRVRSLESKRALPPVSPARAKRVSCELLEVGGAGAGGGSGVDVGVAGGALGGVAQWGHGYEAAGVDGPEGDAGLDGGVHRGVELGLIVDAVEAEAAGEVDEGFLFVELA